MTNKCCQCKCLRSSQDCSSYSMVRTSNMHMALVCFILLWLYCQILADRHQMGTFSALLALCEGNSPVTVNSPHTGQWRGALMFSLICAWTSGWVNNRDTGDLTGHWDHYDVTNYPYSLWLFHWHWATVSEVILKDMGKSIYIKPQLCTKRREPCAYFLGYTVYGF